MDNPQTSLSRGDDFPYELNGGDNKTPPDWAHRAARGVIADLQDRRGLKNELAAVHMDDRKEIVASLAAIIRTAHRESYKMRGRVKPPVFVIHANGSRIRSA